MMKHFPLLLFLLFSSVIYSQNSLDSLKKNVEQKTGDDSVKAMFNIVEYYQNLGNLDSAQIIANDVLQYGIKTANDTILSEAHYRLGHIYVFRNELESANLHTEKSIEISKKNDFNEKLLHALVGKAIIAMQKGNLDESIEIYQNSLEIAKNHNYRLLQAIIYGNIAEVYKDKGFHETATEYIIKSIKISEEIDDHIGVAYMTRSMAINYQEMDNSEKAIDLYLKAAKIFNEENDLYDEAGTYQMLVDLLIEKKKFSMAKRYIDNAKKIFSSIDNENGLIDTEKSSALLYYAQKKYNQALISAKKYSNFYNTKMLLANKIDGYLTLAKIYLALNNTNEANSSLSSAFSYINSSKSLQNWRDYYRLKTEYYKKTRDFENALKNHEKMIAIDDSISQGSNSSRLQDLQIRYEVEKQKSQNDILKQQNDIQALEVEKQQAILYFTILLSVLAISFATILFKRFRANKLLNEELKKLNNTKNKFFSIISHDLKNPFTTLLGYSDMLIQDYDDLSEKEKKGQLIQIRKSAQNTFRLLENLLNWSRTQSEGINISPSKLNLHSIIDDAISHLKSTAEAKQIQIVNNISNQIDFVFDEETIKTTIRNLISNSIKFTNPGGKVEISVVEEEGFFIISVKDNGVGISTDIQKELFKIDVKNSTLGTERETGTGLGLILCKEFVELNNGKIWVKSELEIGSEFFISLPKNKEI